MTAWPKYNPERHEYQRGYPFAVCPWCDDTCTPDHPCTCCARAEVKELRATVERVRGVREKWCDHRSLEMFSAVCIMADLTTALDGGAS